MTRASFIAVIGIVLVGGLAAYDTTRIKVETAEPPAVETDEPSGAETGQPSGVETGEARDEGGFTREERSRLDRGQSVYRRNGDAETEYYQTAGGQIITTERGSVPDERREPAAPEGTPSEAAPGEAMPNPELTPGMIASSDARQVCALGNTAEWRGYSGRPDTKRAIMRAYGLGNRRSADFELDHRVPLCLGGADVVANLWPQPWPEAREKDKIEEWACRAVCDTHTMGLSSAQAIFLGDWRNFKP